MARHVLHIPDVGAPGTRISVSGDEATHALRVKRLREGEELLILNGAGACATAQVVEAKRDLVLEILAVEQAPPLAPAIDVWSAAPKGPRLGELIDGLSQAGAASWTPLRSKRANVDPTAAKHKRLSRIATESMKQSRRPWILQIHTPAAFEAALESEADTQIILADMSGDAYAPSAAARIRILIGPEGGWTDEERTAAKSAGAAIHRFGPHIMRVELAAAAACAIALDHELRCR